MDCDLTSLLNSDPIPTTATVHESELADLLGVTANRVRTLARDGVVKRTSPGRYDRRAAVRDYCAHLRDKAARRGYSKDDSGDLAAEKLRVQRETADKLALANSAARKELVPASEIKAEWAEIAIDLRNALLAVPGRVAARLSLDRTATAALDDEIRLTLEALSRGE